MAAGAVSAPLIIPIIQLPTHRVKNHIDTRTPVSIQSDSAGALIFFTLDGLRPEAGPRGSAGGSRKYTKPILLPAGQVSIRAVAVTADGRQSSIVTKVFYVDQLDSSSTEENQEDVENLRQDLSGGTLSSAENAAGPSLSSAERRTMGRSPPPSSGPRFLNSRLGSETVRAAWTSSSQRLQSADSRDVKQLSSTQEHQVQRETDFLRCSCCLSFLPSDPFARFCAQCGAVVPPFLCGQWQSPAEGAQMRLCVTCNSLVPINTRTCLICEASIGPRMQPQAHLALKDHLVCVSCGSRNPAHTSRCLTCDGHLQQVGCSGNSAPSVHATHSRMFTCSRCKRLNRSNARFCDWCSSKLTCSVSCVECWRCGASGHPYALYCAACGVFLEGPAPPTSSSNSVRPITRDAASGATAEYSHNATRQAVPFSKTPPTITQSTQTVGLYYPSAIELQRKEQQSMLKVSRLLAYRDHHPLLTTISPGRGFWRKQLDHVCAHLRSYTQNNAPFRALLGEPRLGQMVSAVIQEDPHEVSLTISFMLSKQKEPQGGPDRVCGGLDGGGSGPASPTETLSRVTEQFANSSFLSVRKLNSNPTHKPSVTDSQLLKELGPSRGRIRTIQQLLDQGADPSCCGGDGRHALLVAVVSGHHDVLPVLVQRGADVDQQSGPMKNTALHEAAALGSEGLQSAALLLRCKASARLKNAAGQTAYDLAVKSGCSDMVSVLAVQTRPDIQERPRRLLNGSVDVPFQSDRNHYWARTSTNPPQSTTADLQSPGTFR